jgi:uncharacterized repeat protein (TIGR01451 family)
VTNSATVAIVGGGSATSNNGTQVDNGPRLVATKTHSGNFTDGQNGVWTVGVSNTGSTATSGTITLTDTLQNGLTFVSGIGTNWTCSAAAQVVTCTTAAVLNPGDVAPTIALTVLAGPASVGTFTNTVVPSGGNAAYYKNGTNTTTVIGVPRLALAKTHSGTFYAGLQTTYTLTPSNTGTLATSGTLTLVDTLPAGLNYVSASGVGWVCGNSGQVVTCTSTVPIALGSSGNTVGVTVNPQTAAVPSVTNTATLSGGGAATPASASDPTTVAEAPVLGISKTHAGNFVAGTNGTYTITPINSGAQATTGTYTVVDTLPAGLTFVSATGTGWSCSDAGATVTCTSSNVIAASSIGPSITLVVAVAASAVPNVTNVASSSGGGAPNTGSASDVTTVTIPVLSVTKSHVGSFNVGQGGAYTITARNTGNATTFGTTTVTDTLPAGLLFASATGSGWTCSDVAQVVTCTSTAAIAASTAFPAITLNVTVPAGTTPGDVTNSVTASGGDASNTASATDVTTLSQPFLSIAKSHTGSFPVGGSGSYTVTAGNSGNGATFGTTTVTDTLPAGLTYASATGTGWTCGATAQVVTCTTTTSVAAGIAFPSITLNVTVPAATPPGTLTNTATASGGGATNTPTATDPTTISGAAVLALAKSHTGSFVAGQTGTYTLAVSNTGNAATAGTITVTDTLPTGLSFNAASGTGWTCSAAGAVVTCTSATAIAASGNGNPITLTVNVAAGAPASVTNSASASGGGAANTPTATDPTTVVAPILAIAKSHTGNFAIGSTGTYTIAVSNTGTSATAGTLTVIDTLPSGLTFNAASGTGWTCSGAGQTATCTSTTSIAAAASGNPITLTVNVTGAPGSLTNSVTVSGGGASNAPTATDPTTLSGAPVLALAKSHTGSFVAGQTGTYTLAVSNTGNAATAGTITVTDTLPTGLSFNAASGTGWTCSAAGAVVTCTSATAIAASGSGNPITLTVHVAAGAPASVTNSASASGGGAANTPTATDPTTVVTPVLAIAKSHTGNFAIGSPGTYTIAVSNSGMSATAGALTVIDTLPSGLTFNAASGTGWTCSGAGQTATCTSTTSIAAAASGNPITLTVNVTGAPGSLTNSVTVSGGGASNAPTATDVTTLSGAPVLALAKSHTGSFVAGQTGTYTLAVSNTGNAATSGTITVTDTLPAGLSFNAASGTGWTCSAAGAVVTCTSATAIAAAAAGNAITVTVNVAANSPATVTNTANATGGGAANPQTATDPTTIVRPILALAKSHSGNFTVGSTGTYTLAVSNVGTAPTTGPTTVTDTLPAGLTFNAALGTGWTCAATAPGVVCTTNASIAAGGNATPIVLTVNALAAAVPQVTNRASASGGGAGNTPVASDPTTVAGSTALAGIGGLAIEKLVDSVRSTAAAPASSVTYTIGFENTGNVDATGVVFSDTFPAGIAPILASVTVNGSGTGFTAALSGRTLTVTIGVLPPATPETVAIRATVSPAVTTGQTFVNTGSLSANGIAAIQTTPASVFNGSANIVYNASTRAPIAGATIALVDPATGKPIALERAAASGSSTADPQTTAANGSFSFALGPAQFGPPGGSETYRLTVAAHGFSNRSIQAVFAADPTGLLYSVTLTALDGQPLAIEGGFTTVTRSTKISDVLNIIGNVPMFAAGTLEVQKQADRTAASIGDRVVYTITLDATQAFGATRIVDQLPAGLAYAARSGTLDGAALEPRSSGSTQVWQLPSLALGTHTLRYAAILGPGANQNGRLANVVDVTATNPGGGTVHGSAQATVQTIAGPFSDRLTILGRVVVGSADGGWTSVSRGVAGVRVTMEDGTTVVTDAQGRFSFQEVRPAAHVLRLDTSSLPDGVAAYDTHDYNDPRSTVRLVHTIMDTRLIQDVIFVVEEQR